MRRAAKRCFPSCGLLPCLTSSLAWHMKQQGDPEALEQAKQVRTWLAIWWRLPLDKRELVRSAWARSLAKFAALKPNQRWGKVHGLLTGIIVVLLELEWLPSTPCFWYDPSRVRVAHFQDCAEDLNSIMLEVET